MSRPTQEHLDAARWLSVPHGVSRFVDVYDVAQLLADREAVLLKYITSLEAGVGEFESALALLDRWLTFAVVVLDTPLEHDIITTTRAVLAHKTNPRGTP